jgi:hypothetical protein
MFTTSVVFLGKVLYCITFFYSRAVYIVYNVMRYVPKNLHINV